MIPETKDISDIWADNKKSSSEESSVIDPLIWVEWSSENYLLTKAKSIPQGLLTPFLHECL